MKKFKAAKNAAMIISKCYGTWGTHWSS